MIVEKILEGKRYVEITPGYLCDEGELAYMAGIIDGEGSISICKPNRSQPTNFALSMAVCSIDEILIRWIHRRFGGYTCSEGRTPSRKKVYYRWAASGPQAALILEATRDWLTIKQSKADWAIAFQSSKPKRGFHPLSPERLAKCQWFKKELSNARCH